MSWTKGRVQGENKRKLEKICSEKICPELDIACKSISKLMYMKGYMYNVG